MQPPGFHLVEVIVLICLFSVFPDAHGQKKDNCRYTKSRGPCNPKSQTQLISYTLREGENPSCKLSKVKTRSCDSTRTPLKFSDCTYFRSGRRSPCDVETGMRTITVKLRFGGASCSAVRKLLKPCASKRLKKKIKNKNKECKYFRRGDKGPCDFNTGTRTIIVRLKRGNALCSRTKTVVKVCKSKKNKRKRKKLGKCRYSQTKAIWGACDVRTNLKTKVLRLESPKSNPHCAPTKVKARKCRGKKRENDCVYVRGVWSECDRTTNTRRREKVLTYGDPTMCLPKKVVTKACRKECRYMKSNWTECDPDTKQKNQTLTPQPGSPPQCQPTINTKLCSPRAELTEAKAHKCKYNSNEWSPCDPRSNTMTQIMTLKNGDPNVCLRTVKQIKKCRIACKFRKGNWTECDTHTGLTTRIDTLLKGHPENCDATRLITKKCRKKACKYELGTWSECDPETGERFRVRKLLKGDVQNCRKEEIISKSCLKKDGRARCFFGSFGEFGPCTNGVMTKHRPVLQGSVECQRKAVITKACG